MVASHLRRHFYDTHSIEERGSSDLNEKWAIDVQNTGLKVQVLSRVISCKQPMMSLSSISSMLINMKPENPMKHSSYCRSKLNTVLIRWSVVHVELLTVEPHS